jgi:hypothetical protein
VQCRVSPLRGGYTAVWFLSTDVALVDPLSGWMPPEGPTRRELEPAMPVEEVIAKGGGAA